MEGIDDYGENTLTMIPVEYTSIHHLFDDIGQQQLCISTYLSYYRFKIRLDKQDFR